MGENGEKGVKIAISGKGGTGKTLLAALLCRALKGRGYKVLAVDADPDANLAATLGFPDPCGIRPIVEMEGLIEERTGARPGARAAFFKLNPRVDDIPEKYAVEHEGIKLIVMGSTRRGGSGCYCPENAFIRALMANLLVGRGEAVVMDMEAGIEHLGRGTARAVDALIVVVEPSRRSVETAFKVRRMASDLGIRRVFAVGNKIKSGSDREFLVREMGEFEFLGFLPFSERLLKAEVEGRPPVEADERLVEAACGIAERLLEKVRGVEERSPTVA